MIPIIDIKDSWLEAMSRTGMASAGEVRAMAHELLKLRKETRPKDPEPFDAKDLLQWNLTP